MDVVHPKQRKQTNPMFILNERDSLCREFLFLFEVVGASQIVL